MNCDQNNHLEREVAEQLIGHFWYPEQVDTFAVLIIQESLVDNELAICDSEFIFLDPIIQKHLASALTSPNHQIRERAQLLCNR